MPARSRLVTDLDKLVSTARYFRFQGREYALSPVSTGRFLKLSDSLSRIQGLLKQNVAGNKIVNEDVYDVYEEFFTTVCDKITRKDIEAMSLAQVSALVDLVLTHVMGDDTPVDEKKNPIAETVEYQKSRLSLSLQRLVGSSGGRRKKH